MPPGRAWEAEAVRSEGSGGGANLAMATHPSWPHKEVGGCPPMTTLWLRLIDLEKKCTSQNAKHAVIESKKWRLYDAKSPRV
jgi:hypothetical protein